MEGKSIGYDIKLLVGKPDEELICVICLHLLRDPMECSKCNTLFCKKCIDGWLRIKKECPNRCKMSQDAVIRPASRVICKLINKHIITCRFCEDQIKVEYIDDHEKNCKLPKCANPLCKKDISNSFKIEIPGSIYACSERCKFIYQFDQNAKANKQASPLEILQDMLSKIKLEQDSQGKFFNDNSNQQMASDSPQSDSKSNFNAFIEFGWEKECSSEKVQISPDLRQLTLNESEFKYRNVFGNQGFISGIHYWEIIIDSQTQNEMKIGVSKIRNNLNGGSFADNDQGWCYFGLGELRHANDYSGPKYGKKFSKSGIVGVYLNMNKGIIGFTLNGEYFGIAFKDSELEKGPIYPAVSLLRKGGCTLVSAKQIPSFIKS